MERGWVEKRHERAKTAKRMVFAMYTHSYELLVIINV